MTSTTTRMMWAVLAAGFLFLAATLAWESARSVGDQAPLRSVEQTQLF